MHSEGIYEYKLPKLLHKGIGHFVVTYISGKSWLKVFAVFVTEPCTILLARDRLL